VAQNRRAAQRNKDLVVQAFLPVFRVNPAVTFFSKKKNTGRNVCGTEPVE
jgi:hypothetical protein